MGLMEKGLNSFQGRHHHEHTSQLHPAEGHHSHSHHQDLEHALDSPTRSETEGNAELCDHT